MPGKHSSFHIQFNDPLTHKKVPTSRRWTIGDARDMAISEIRSHLGDSFPDATMPLANDVKIFKEQETGQSTSTLIRNLRSSENGDYLAFVPAPANTGFGALLTKLHDDIKQMKMDSEVTRREFEQKFVEHEWELADLRAQQDDTLSWMVIGVHPSSLIVLGDNYIRWQEEGILDRIMLRNLLDKAQTVVADACNLEMNNQESSSWKWRSQFTGISHLEDHLVKATELLQKSSLDKSIVRQICASQRALSILSEKSDIRREGDRLAHEEQINTRRYTIAIERQSQSDPEKSQALKLLLKVVKGRK